MSQFITLQRGIDMTTAYRTQRSILINNGAVSADLLPICETFDKAMVLALLGQHGAAAMRAYLGLEDGKMQIIFVAADDKDEDILPSADSSSTGSYLLDNGSRCPIDCPPPSPLND